MTHSGTTAMIARYVVYSVLALVLATTGKAEEPTAKTIGTVSRTVTVIAEVQSIDLPNRIVVLRQREKPPVALKVDEEARNLPQLRVGDTVKAEFTESLLVRLHKPGAAEPGLAISQSGARAALGEKPGGAVQQQETIVAPVVALDVPKRRIVLRDTDGSTVDCWTA